MHGLNAKRTSPTSAAYGLTEAMLTPAPQLEPSEHRARLHWPAHRTQHTPRLADNGQGVGSTGQTCDTGT